MSDGAPTSVFNCRPPWKYAGINTAKRIVLYFRVRVEMPEARKHVTYQSDWIPWSRGRATNTYVFGKRLRNVSEAELAQADRRSNFSTRESKQKGCNHHKANANQEEACLFFQKSVKPKPEHQARRVVAFVDFLLLTKRTAVKLAIHRPFLILFRPLFDFHKMRLPRKRVKPFHKVILCCGGEAPPSVLCEDGFKWLSKLMKSARVYAGTPSHNTYSLCLRL